MVATSTGTSVLPTCCNCDARCDEPPRCSGTSSGKSTLAPRIQHALAPYVRWVLLDSDELHDALGAHGDARGDRNAFCEASAGSRRRATSWVAATAARRA